MPKGKNVPAVRGKCRAATKGDRHCQWLAKPQVLTEGLLYTKKYPSVTNVTAPLYFDLRQKEGSLWFVHTLEQPSSEGAYKRQRRCLISNI